tara:strand:- start:58 stop:654 length:597 start_codon:yes stop_codon:yes gene_type:complete
MAIIYTYPLKSTPALEDLILISDMSSKKLTKSATITSLKDTIDVVDSFNSLTGAVTITGGTNVTLNTSGNNIEINSPGVGTGTINKIPKWSANGSDIEDSIITEDAGPGIVVAGNVSLAANSYINTPSILDDAGEQGTANQVLSAGAAGVSILWTSSLKLSGLRVTSLAEHADNTAALAAGLVAGDFYRTVDFLKVVH